MRRSCAALLLATFSAFSALAHAGEGPVRVVASVPPLAFLAERIAGDGGEAEVLLQPGQEPHTFDAKPQQIARILRADLLVTTGLLGFERELASRIRAMEGAPAIVEAASGLPLRPIEGA